jgi:L-2,4-diaminobutyric acid acetyltransferase
MELHPHRYLATAGPAAWVLRPPDPGDGAALHALIASSPPLDLNSCYAYLLHGLHFADTCLLAECDGELLAYVSAYRPPGRADTLFVWQIAVAARVRGQGLAHLLLEQLLARPACRAVRWLETTVTPDNTASARLFRGLARARGCACRVSELFSRECFGAGTHAAEQLFRIGPLLSSAVQERPHASECL